MKRRFIAFLSAFLILVCLCSCTAPEKDGGYISFTDSTGAEIRLAQKPQKVAVLFSSFAEIWNLAGGDIYATVGESIERGFCKEGTLLADSGAGKTINAELLISYEPDFVICSADIPAQSQAAQMLNAAGIPAAQFSVESFEDYLNMLKICTDITGNGEAYKTYGTDIKLQIDKILENADNSGKSILFIRAGSTAKSTKAKTSAQHFACTMLNELGTHNITENAPVLLDGLSIEEILIQNPDYIFIATMGDEQAAKENISNMFKEPAWQSLDAIKNGRYHFLPKELFQYKPNARWAQAYAYLAEILNDKAQ